MKSVRVVIVAIAIAAGCSSAATQSSAGRGNGNQLTHAQLVATNSENVFQALEKLRPEWLTTRGPTSVTDATPSAPSVFMNGQMLGKADYLREVRVVDVTTIRFWPAGQASARFGMGHPRGVIEITRQ